MTDRLWRAAIRPLLFRLDAELAHRIAFAMLRAALVLAPLRAAARRLAGRDPALRTEALGLTFLNPVGLAAGFDKDAAGFAQLAALGFGFVEVGTVTPQPQAGNAKPRLFRLPADRALLNRMGFNNHGAAATAARLRRRRPADGVVGANVGRNRDSSSAVEDYVDCTQTLGPLADYVAVNVSSPNTAGLRDLQRAESLRPLLAAVRDATDRPILVKVAPDLGDDELDEIADLAVELGIHGIIATNTTISRAGLRTPAADLDALGSGGLSGAPLQAQALYVLRRLHARVGDRLVLVAAGGIETADDAWARIRAGATLVQLYTGFVYGGPATPRRLANGLAELARSDGFARVQDAVGVDATALETAGAARAAGRSR